MKLLYNLLFLVPVLAQAQSTEQNYIKTTAYKVATQNGTTQTTGGTAVTDAHRAVNIGYFDGMGRPIQQIAFRQSAEGKNIIVPITYDALGRKTRDYLPFPSQSTSLLYTDNTSVISSLESFYAGEFGADGQYPYSEKQLESSPLNRVQKQSAPGVDWALPAVPTAPDHTIRFEYLANGANEVRLFTATSSSPSAGQYAVALSNSGHYAAGELFKTKVKDENWKTEDNNNNTTDEFKDKQGRVVLKRSYESGEAYDTYYVYDQYSNLSYVIPPKVNTGQTITNPILEELCYQYRYDNRNRLVEKRLPGKGWEYIVYDRMDRVVATGPANAPFTDLIVNGKKGWLITKYDAFNRAVLTAWKEAVFTTTTRKTLQDLHDSKTVLSEARAAETTINGVAMRYTNQAEPTAGYHILTVNYYDDYEFTSLAEWVPTTLPPTSRGQVVFYDRTNKPKGLATGSWVRVLEASTNYRNERSYILYDVKSRPILNFKRNHLLGSDLYQTVYDFEGKVLQTQTTHGRMGSSVALTVSDYFAYTDQGRLSLHTHKIDSGALELLAKNEYDKLGQLKSKKVGSPYTSTLASHQNVNYSYNIRGWLKGINKMDNLVQPGDPKDLFAFALNYNTITNELKYEDGNVKPLYNGNISETFWKTSSDGLSRKYGYRYDHLNRLTAAVYQKPDLGPGSPAEITRSYDEKMSYDKNGNIMFLKRNGYLDSNDPLVNYQIDDLGYSYAPNSNKLLSVSDSSGSLDGFLDGNQQGNAQHPIDYEYDEYGNMTADWNKAIESISYNHLNLPVKIRFKVDREDKIIEYLYNAVGSKIGKRTVHQSATVNIDNTTLYLAGFQYLNDVLQFFPTSEGYVNVTGSANNYVFNYVDHLGNIRLTYTEDPVSGALTVLEQSHYYPYGMKHSNYNEARHDYRQGEGGIYAVIRAVDRSNYQYKYNGKEYQDELGLNVYDMDLRDYDPATGRWTGIDPVTHHNMSPYNAFDGNPVFWADPSGTDAVTFTKGSDGEFRMTSYQSDKEVLEELSRIKGFDIDDYLNSSTAGNVFGDKTIIGSLIYNLISGTKSIHEISFTQLIKFKLRSVNSGLGQIDNLIDYVNFTTIIRIQLVNKEVVFTTQTVTNYGTRVLGGSNIFQDCAECFSKSVASQESSGLSVNPVANAAANFIGDRIKVDSKYNLFNQTSSILPSGFGLGASAVKYFTQGGIEPITWGVEMAETFDYYRKKHTDFTGRIARYNVFSDGTMKLIE